MNTAETLARLSHALHLLAADYPGWHNRPMADGYATRTPGHGLPTGHGVNTISDPTLDAATSRIAQSTDEGGDLWVQAHQAATHAYGLSWRLWRHAQGSDAPPLPVPHGASVGLICQIAGDALESAGRPGVVGVFRRATIGGIAVRDVLDAIRADVDTLRAIVPARRVEAKWAKEELCNGGPRDATWHQPHPEDKPAPAVTRDGLCDTCRRRRDRHEARETAA